MLCQSYEVEHVENMLAVALQIRRGIFQEVGEENTGEFSFEEILCIAPGNVHSRQAVSLCRVVFDSCFVVCLPRHRSAQCDDARRC